MCLKEEERIGENDKVLVVVTNQYMFEQLLWYHSKYPEGVWEAIVIKFGYDDDLLSIMNKKCKECGLFETVICYDNWMPQNSLSEKMLTMLKYIFQYITRSRERCDRKLIESITEKKCDYKKVIVHSTYSLISVASINAMSEAVLICMEDGLADYLPAEGIKYGSELLNYVLAKLNVINMFVRGHRFKMKYDNRIIKYVSLPDKMRYRNYKSIKRLFKDDNRKISYSEKELLLKKQGYDVIVFSTTFSDFGQYEELYYSTLQEWLKKHYNGKKILFKPHPRERCKFNCDDLDIHIDGREIAGEKLLELLPSTELVFTYTTTILLKACREKRGFKVLYFKNINSKWYRLALKNDSDLLGIRDADWITLGDEEDE